MNDERGKGGCLKMLLGCFGVLLLLTAIGFGVYYWLVPEKRVKQIEKVEKVWGQVKNKVDDGLEKAKPPAEPE